MHNAIHMATFDDIQVSSLDTHAHTYTRRSAVD